MHYWQTCYLRECTNWTVFYFQKSQKTIITVINKLLFIKFFILLSGRVLLGLNFGTMRILQQRTFQYRRLSGLNRFWMSGKDKTKLSTIVSNRPDKVNGSIASKKLIIILISEQDGNRLQSLTLHSRSVILCGRVGKK